MWGDLEREDPPPLGKDKMTQGLMHQVDALCQLCPRLEAHFTDQ